jgi:hypothetical protein
MAVPDVVEHGLVDSLGRPGGNITGISVPMDDLLRTRKTINVRSSAGGRDGWCSSSPRETDGA